MTQFRQFNCCGMIASLLLILSSESRAFNDPVTGRWITRDPIGYADGMNLYEYMASSATYWRDPSGKKINSKELDDDTFGKLKNILPPCCTWTSNFCTGDLQADCSGCDFKNSPGMTEILKRLQDILKSKEEYVITSDGNGVPFLQEDGKGGFIQSQVDNLDGIIAEGATFPPKKVKSAPGYSTDDKWHVYYHHGLCGDEATSTIVHELLGHGWPPGKGNFDKDHKAAYRIENIWRKIFGLSARKNAHLEKVKRFEERRQGQQEYRQRAEERRQQQEEKRRQRRR